MESINIVVIYLDMKSEIAKLLRQEIILLKNQNRILAKNTWFTGAGSLIAILAFVLAILALMK